MCGCRRADHSALGSGITLTTAAAGCCLWELAAAGGSSSRMLRATLPVSAVCSTTRGSPGIAWCRKAYTLHPQPARQPASGTHKQTCRNRVHSRVCAAQLACRYYVVALQHSSTAAQQQSVPCLRLAGSILPFRSCQSATRCTASPAATCRGGARQGRQGAGLRRQQHCTIVHVIWNQLHCIHAIRRRAGRQQCQSS